MIPFGSEYTCGNCKADFKTYAGLMSHACQGSG